MSYDELDGWEDLTLSPATWRRLTPVSKETFHTIRALLRGDRFSERWYYFVVDWWTKANGEAGSTELRREIRAVTERIIALLETKDPVIRGY